MTVLDISKKPPEITLVFSRALMLFALEWGVFHVSAAVLAPVFWLSGSDQQ
jgi:hypothetical protein